MKSHHIQETFPNPEVVILVDFNAHNNNWIKHSTHTAFAIRHDLTQLV